MTCMVITRVSTNILMSKVSTQYPIFTHAFARQWRLLIVECPVQKVAAIQIAITISGPIV